MLHRRTATALVVTLALVLAVLPSTALAAGGGGAGANRGDLGGAIVLLLAAGLVVIGLDAGRSRSDA